MHMQAGRPSGPAHPERFLQVASLYALGKGARAIATETGIPLGTVATWVYKYLKPNGTLYQVSQKKGPEVARPRAPEDSSSQPSATSASPTILPSIQETKPLTTRSRGEKSREHRLKDRIVLTAYRRNITYTDLAMAFGGTAQAWGQRMKRLDPEARRRA